MNSLERATNELRTEIQAHRIRISIPARMVIYGKETVIIPPYAPTAQCKAIIRKFIKQHKLTEKAEFKVEQGKKQSGLF